MRALIAVATSIAGFGSVLELVNSSALAAPEGASYVLLGGSVYTVNDKQPWAQAVAVRGDRIVHDVAYGIGDANLAEFDRLDAGAVGLCPQGSHAGHRH